MATLWLTVLGTYIQFMALLSIHFKAEQICTKLQSFTAYQLSLLQVTSTSSVLYLPGKVTSKMNPIKDSEVFLHYHLSWYN